MYIPDANSSGGLIGAVLSGEKATNGLRPGLGCPASLLLPISNDKLTERPQLVLSFRKAFCTHPSGEHKLSWRAFGNMSYHH